MRNMSFSMTTQQMYDGTKSVTRRLGWWTLKPGDVLMAVEKCQGLKRGEHVVKIYPIEIVSVESQELWWINKPECKREGFPELSPVEFVDMFCEHNKCEPFAEVNRIEFKKWTAA